MFWIPFVRIFVLLIYHPHIMYIWKRLREVNYVAIWIWKLRFIDVDGSPSARQRASFFSKQIQKVDNQVLAASHSDMCAVDWEADKETERHRERQKYTEKDRKTQRKTERHRERQKDTEKDRKTHRKTHKKTERHIERHIKRQKDTEKNRKTHRKTHKKTERHRERHNDRKTQRQTERQRGQKDMSKYWKGEILKTVFKNIIFDIYFPKTHAITKHTTHSGDSSPRSDT
jgi:hypothetical protein